MMLPGKGVDISLAGGLIEVVSNVHLPGEAVVSMRPVSAFTKGPGSEIEQNRISRHRTSLSKPPSLLGYPRRSPRSAPLNEGTAGCWSTAIRRILDS
jgi:hypothetical protein